VPIAAKFAPIPPVTAPTFSVAGPKGRLLATLIGFATQRSGYLSFDDFLETLLYYVDHDLPDLLPYAFAI
jgi:hypothetical protein